MRDWIVIGVLYAFGMGLFRMFGGISAAGDALRRWGRSSTTVPPAHSPSS